MEEDIIAEAVMIGMPHTPVGSPLGDSHPTMQQILVSTMEKVDKDIVNMDKVIKKVTSELVVSLCDMKQVRHAIYN